MYVLKSRKIVLLLLLAQGCAWTSPVTTYPRPLAQLTLARSRRGRSSSTRLPFKINQEIQSKLLAVADSSVEEANFIVDRLLNVIEDKDIEDFGNETIIDQLMCSLAQKQEKDKKDLENIDRFIPLLGNYDVIHVAASKSTVSNSMSNKKKRKRQKTNSPAGGKWTRKGGIAQMIFRERRKFQHLLRTNKTESVLVKNAQDTGKCNSTEPLVAEAVNVVSLDAFFGLLRLSVILKGDAIPLTLEERLSIAKEKSTPGGLSPYAVRAFFDSPRIILGKSGRMSLRLGPTSSVVLDTTFIDSKIRLGKGSLGSQFVFKRCDEDDTEANEWMQLYERKPIQKKRTLFALTCSFVSGLGMISLRNWRVMGSSISLLSSLFAIAIANSTGGIEEEHSKG